MIMTYLGNGGVSQCQEATDYPFVPPQTVPPTDWCASPPDTLGFTGWPQFGRYGFTAIQTSYGAAITWAQLVTEIDSDRPVAFVWAWQHGGGHMMVAIGYETVDNVNKVVINDPSPPNVGNRRSIRYADFVEGSYNGEPYTHWCDFYGIAMNHPGAPGAGPPSAASDSLAAAQAYMSTVLKGLGPGATPTSASLAAAFPVKAVGLNQLKQLSAPGASPQNVVDSTPISSFVYGVVLQGSVTAAISTYLPPRGTWTATDANASWVRIFSEVRTQHSVSNNIPLDHYSLVAFNALNLYFLAYSQDAGTFLVPTQDDATHGFLRGISQPAHNVLDAVIKIAVRHAGGPS
jgi:hypothetical protein